jgi:hypothetical protein
VQVRLTERLEPPQSSDRPCLAFSVATPDPTARIVDVDYDVNPDILTGGIVTPAEVEKLFKM